MRLKELRLCLEMIGLALTAGLLSTCSCTGAPPENDLHVQQAATSPGLTTLNLGLTILTNSCGANQAQDFFQVANNTNASVALSDLKIKFWLNETNATSLIASLNTPGCIVSNMNCTYSVPSSNATITATKFSPACGADANHQANWEITIASTDTHTIPVGGTWSNVQAALRLPNGANFRPGTSTWYSPCLNGVMYATDNHFGLYYRDTLVYSSGLSPPVCRSPRGSRQLSDYLSPSLTNAQFVKPVPEATPITLDLTLPVRTPPGQPTLTEFAEQVTDPAGPLYRQYLSQQQFMDRYAPTAADQQPVVDWAQNLGFTSVRASSSRMVVSVTGPASLVKRALYTNLNYYKRLDGSYFYAPDREPSIDLNSPLIEIGTLNNFVAPKPSVKIDNTWGTNRLLNNGYGLGDGTYGFGEGECVGLVVYDGFSLADPTFLNGVRTIYASHPQLVPPRFRAVLLNPAFVSGQPAPLGCLEGGVCGSNPECPAGTNCCMMTNPLDLRRIVESTCNAACAPDAGTEITGSACPSADNLSSAEVALDMDMAMTLAAGLSEVVLYEGGGTNVTLDSMASDSAKCRQLSSSWNMGVEKKTVDLLNRLAAQGQGFSIASGDDGAVPDTTSIQRLAEVTVVGGTVLKGTAQDATPNVFEYTSETPWPQSGSFIANGVLANNVPGSPAVPIPDYQQGVNMTFCADGGAFCNGSTTFRSVPDLAMVASQVDFRTNGHFSTASGTSISSPLWASFLAVANSFGKKHGIPSIGAPNKSLYAIGKSRGTVNDLYKDAFHDLSTDNTKSFNPPCRPGHDCGPPSVATNAWPAVDGYDLASGWGSPTPKLIDALTNTVACKPQPGAPGVITEFQTSSVALFLTAGPDCNVWFTELGNGGKVGRITPTGTITEFPVPSPHGSLLGITTGPDGSLWFVAVNSIYRMTVTGDFTKFPLTEGIAFEICAGPDNNLWFTTESNKIGRITTSGVITEFTVPVPGFQSRSITVADGNLWFTSSSLTTPNVIGRVTPDGVFTLFQIPAGSVDSSAFGITAGADGNLWYTKPLENRIGRISPAGSVIEYDVPSANSLPLIITAGPDGNLWFTEEETFKIARISPAGVITEFVSPSPPPGSQIGNHIITGPDGNIWFTESEIGKIGRITPP